MKLKQVVKRDFVELEPSAKADFTDFVVKDMGENVDKFTTPDPPLTTLTELASDVRKHYKASLKGDEDEVTLLKEAVAKLDSALRTLATYVDLVSKGDEIIINMAGFKATKSESTPSKPPLKPDKFIGNPGTSRGTIILELEKLEFATFYTFVIGKNISGISFNSNAVVVNSNTEVLVLTSKKIRVVIKNLESNSTYQCLVFGTSSKAGKGAVSEIITITTF